MPYRPASFRLWRDPAVHQSGGPQPPGQVIRPISFRIPTWQWRITKVSGQLSVVTSSQGFLAGQWVGPGEFVAALGGTRALRVFNLIANTWSEQVPEAVNWAHSLNYKYLYYTTGGAEPNAMRIWLSSRSTCNGANGPTGIRSNLSSFACFNGSPSITRFASSTDVVFMRNRCSTGHYYRATNTNSPRHQ